jgi:UDP-3-O-[3-hydroxymyristoyl] glucosamine N-acyltransferase
MRRNTRLVLRLSDFARRIGATLENVSNGQDPEVIGVGALEDAREGEIAFLSDTKWIGQATNGKAAAFIVSGEIRVPGRPCLVVPHVWKAVLAAIDLFWPDEPAPAGVHPTAVVDPSVQIGEGSSIGPLVVIEAGAIIGKRVEIGAQCFVGRDAQIGDGTVFHPGVRVLERVQVGRGVILHSGVVLGSDGYGFEIIDGWPVKIPQIGTVVVEDQVEMGANCCIDRAFLRETRIGAGSKLDNLVHIAHNCKIGRSCGFAAQVGVAGSVEMGDGCMFWGQAGVRDHVKLGNRVTVNAQSGVVGNLPDGVTVMRSPAVPATAAARIIAAEDRLPEALKRLRVLEKKME